MSRKQISDVEQMDDEVIKCYIHPVTGREETTPAERREVAERWCSGDYTYHHAIAFQHGLLPIALLIAALIDIDHPLLVSGRGVVFNSLQCAVIVTQAMLHKTKVAQPLPDSFNTQPVERIN